MQLYVMVRGVKHQLIHRFATGIIAETRIPADKKSNYYQLRELEASKPSLLQGLFSKGGN
jgi:hypothetical protein